MMPPAPTLSERVLRIWLQAGCARHDEALLLFLSGPLRYLPPPRFLPPSPCTPESEALR
jgi:hypothetical protein